MKFKQIAIVASLLLVSATAVGCAQNSKHSETDAGTVTPASEKDKNAGPGDNRAGKPSGPTARLDINAHLPDMVEKTLPGVVGISTKKVVESRPHQFPFGQNPFFRGMPFGQQRPPQQREKEGMGSGVVVDKKGIILTNNHVVEGADEIRVSFSDRRDEYRAEIVGTDKATDVAVLELKDPPEDLKPLPIGNSDDLRLGEPVVAIGNPFGLSSSVTYGIVSAKGRANVGLADYEDFIQTDAAINPGNSGGALVNMEGELIGINTAIMSRSGGYQGIGFAIPSNMAQSVMQKLLDTGTVQRGFLGVSIQTLSPELADGLGLAKSTKGVLIAGVKEGSPADESGLKQADVITELEGQPVDDANDLRNAIAQKSPGTSVELTVKRDGQTRTMNVKLGSLHGGEDGKLSVDDKKMGVLQGLVLGSLDGETRQKFQIPDRVDHGIGVLDIKRGSPAARTGLRPGDVILEVNRQKLDSVRQFSKAYEQAKRKILLLVYRDGQTLFLAVPKVE